LIFWELNYPSINLKKEKEKEREREREKELKECPSTN
jgi:hypothetical protein